MAEKKIQPKLPAGEEPAAGARKAEKTSARRVTSKRVARRVVGRKVGRRISTKAI
jgi:hypothetical protein